MNHWAPTALALGAIVGTAACGRTSLDEADSVSTCEPGEAALCYSGPDATANVGACVSGVKVCDDTGRETGACIGEVTPVAEDCTNALDDDCDGIVNDGCPCSPGWTESCYSGPFGTQGVGSCTTGFQICDDLGTGFGVCEGDVTPVPEHCATEADDDCDGLVNEDCACSPGAAESCYFGPRGTEGVGACQPGSRVCNDAGTGFGLCVGGVTPVPEDCETMIDDDCNGTTNDGCVCVPGELESCYSGPALTEGVGPCRAGTHACDASGTGFGTCFDEVLPLLIDDCATPADDDCDGIENDGCICVPGEVEICYSGPPGTAGVGSCQAGTQACSADGTAFGPCVGEVTPAPEDCDTTADEDCDGLTPPCPGELLCGGTFGGVDWLTFHDVGVDASGSIAIGGRLSGQADLGGGLLVSAGAGDALLASFDDQCVHEWSARYGDAASQGATGIRRRPSGEVVATGVFQSTIDFGLGTHVASSSAFGVELDAFGNGTVWDFVTSGFSIQSIRMAIGPSGRIALVGCFGGTVGFGGAPLVTAGSDDLFVAMLDATGGHVWSKRFGDAERQCSDSISPSKTPSVAFDAAGDVIIAGSFRGTVDLGGGPLTSLGGHDVLVAKLAATGAHVWSKRFGSASAFDYVESVATGPSGEILLGGSYRSPVDFGGGPLATAGTDDIFLVSLAPNGDHGWSRGFAFTGTQHGGGVAADANGNVLLTGSAIGPCDFGGGPTSGAFVAKFNPAGQHLWSRGFAAAGYQQGYAVATDDDGNVVVVGRFDGTIDFGSGPIANVGQPDAFLVKLAP